MAIKLSLSQKVLNLLKLNLLKKLVFQNVKSNFINYVKAGLVINNLFPTAKLGKLDDVQM